MQFGLQRPSSSPDRSSTAPGIPASPMPMTPQVHRVGGHGHHVAHAGGDVVGTAGAHVALDSLIRLDAVHLKTGYMVQISHRRRQPHRAHASRPAATIEAAPTKT